MSTYDPKDIKYTLMDAGFIIDQDCEDKETTDAKNKKSKDLEMIDKAFRLFSRTTYVGKELFKIKLGESGNFFINQILPKLEKSGILEQKNTEGHEKYRLKIPMSFILKCFKKSQGSFENFISLAEKYE